MSVTPFYLRSNAFQDGFMEDREIERRSGQARRIMRPGYRRVLARVHAEMTINKKRRPGTILRAFQKSLSMTKDPLLKTRSGEQTDCYGN
jgi:hypothetical protein